MKLLSRLSWGIVLYAMMYLLWSGFILYNFIGTGARIVALLILIALSVTAGRSLRLSSWKDVLPYSLAWAVIIGLFDAIFSVPYSGWQIYGDWNLWVGYGLVVLVPLLTPYTRSRDIS
jgi:hypothetical protein